jgi:hypothetical protein
VRKPSFQIGYGQIAVLHSNGDGLVIAMNTANERDWRLFQEFAAQADSIISSGGYLREWVQGHAQEVLKVDDPLFFV